MEEANSSNNDVGGYYGYWRGKNQFYKSDYFSGTGRRLCILHGAVAFERQLHDNDFTGIKS